MASPTALIVGGTGFVGAWTTRAAVEAGCEVTVLHRGRTEARLPPVTRLHADRDGDLSALRGRHFDLVVDVVPYRPAQVHALLDALGDDGLEHLVLVSSVSAADLSVARVRETQPGIQTENPDQPTYGEAKAACERAALERLGHRACVVRPGLIGGPGDRSDRATYWARRAARGGPAVAPGSPADELQLIDVRDLAPFLVRVGLGRETGALHAVGAEVRWGDFLRGVAERTGDRVQWRWAPAEVLARHGLRAWIDLPLWMPAVGPYRGACHVDRTLAMTAGLWTRDPAETAVDGWAWRQAHPGDPSGVGIDPEVEAKILAEL